MRLEIKKLLFDIRDAGRAIADFTADKSLDDYHATEMLRAAVERKFTVIGEALNRLSRLDAPTADRIGEFRKIVAFRNTLIHGYDLVNHSTVWQTIHEDLPLLPREVESLLAEPDDDQP